MSEPRGGHPIQVVVILLLLGAGGWYFFKHYEVAGLDGVSVQVKDSLSDYDELPGFQEAPLSLASVRSSHERSSGTAAGGRFSLLKPAHSPASPGLDSPPRAYKKLRIAGWALSGFGPTKFASAEVRRTLATVVRNFDIVAIQQVASIERDLIPRMVEAINHGDARYDFVSGSSSGPDGRQEQLAFLFDRHRVVVDRQQTYTVDDPDQQLTYDPLVAWFRAAEPPGPTAWTFSLVNVRIDLARAPAELAVLPAMLSAISQDGRGEDDVVLVGLFQADDAYLVPSLGIQQGAAAIRNRPTDIFGRYQTANLLFDSVTTTEYLGGGGVYDFPRRLGLNRAQAEAVTSQLPVYAEFTALEGGQL